MTRLGVPRWIAAAALLALGATARAAGPIALPAQSFPESLSIASKDFVFVGSAMGGVVRVDLHTGRATPFVAPGAGGSASIFGVLADQRNGMLWVCSNDFSRTGVLVPGGEQGHSVKGFDLQTGTLRISLPLPGEKSLCNDLAIGTDGSLFVTDTSAPRILRWRAGTAALEVWVDDPVLGNGLDGLAFGDDGSLYVNNIRSGALLRIAVRPDGMPGTVSMLHLPRPLQKPDGMRAIGGNSFVLAEGGGQIDRVMVRGDVATIQPLAEQLAGPTGVDVRDGTAWYVEGQLGALFDPARRANSTGLLFKITPISLRH